MSEHTRKLALAAVLVASATAVSRVVGLAREVVVAGVYGVSSDYSAFVSVSAVPTTVRQLFADAAISAAFVPILVALIAAGDPARARRVTGALLGFMITVVGAAVLVLMVAAGPIVRSLYPELTTTAEPRRRPSSTSASSRRPSWCSRSPASSPACSSPTSASSMPAVVSIVWNLVIIAFVTVWHASWGVSAARRRHARRDGRGAGPADLVAVRAVGEPLRVNFHFRDDQLRRVLALMVPISITLGILNFNALVNMYFAQYVEPPGRGRAHLRLPAVHAAPGHLRGDHRHGALPLAVAVRRPERRGALSRDALDGVRQTVFVSLPFLGWFAVLAAPIVRVVFQRRAFSADDTAAVAPVLAAFALGLTFANVNMMFNRSFQSMQRPWLPLYVGSGQPGTQRRARLGPAGAAGAPGIALSTSLVSIFNTRRAGLPAARPDRGARGPRIATTIGKTLLCAALPRRCGGRGRGARSKASPRAASHVPLALLVAVAASGATYVGAARLLRLEELGWRGACCAVGPAGRGLSATPAWPRSPATRHARASAPPPGHRVPRAPASPPRWPSRSSSLAALVGRRLGVAGGRAGRASDAAGPARRPQPVRLPLPSPRPTSDPPTVIEIGWVGDTTPGSKYGYPPDNGRALFAQVRDELRAPDLMIANLEGTYSAARAVEVRRQRLLALLRLPGAALVRRALDGPASTW